MTQTFFLARDIPTVKQKRIDQVLEAVRESFQRARNPIDEMALDFAVRMAQYPRFGELADKPEHVFASYDVPALKATVYPITDATPNHIAIVARPRGSDWLCEEISSLSREGIEILVSMLTDEEAEELGLNDESAECAAAGISFVNVPIPDRSVPSDTNAFCRIVEQLATRVREGRYLAVHCRASIGRSSMLAASILVRLGWDAKTAFDTIEAARGCSVPDTSDQKQWVIANVPTVR